MLRKEGWLLTSHSIPEAQLTSRTHASDLEQRRSTLYMAQDVDQFKECWLRCNNLI